MTADSGDGSWPGGGARVRAQVRSSSGQVTSWGLYRLSWDTYGTPGEMGGALVWRESLWTGWVSYCLR